MANGTYSGTYAALTIYGSNAKITSTASIVNSAADSIAVSVQPTGASATLSNAGYISASDSQGTGVYFYSLGTLTNTGTIRGDIAVALNFGGTIANNGTLSAYSTGVLLDSGVFTNEADGRILTRGDYGVGVKLSGNASGGNAGLIGVLVDQNPNPSSIYPNTFGVILTGSESFDNTGKIELFHVYGYKGTFTGVTATSGGTITNSGEIEAGGIYYHFIQPKTAGRGASPAGLHLVRDATVGEGVVLTNSTAFNSGIIAAHNVGLVASSSYVDNSGYIGALSAGIELISGTVVNTGSIEAVGANYNAGVYMLGGVLSNSGTIRNTGTYQSYGIYANSSNPLAITNQRGGVISGLIGIDFNDSSGQTLVNAGTITTYGTGTTAIRFGSGDDLLVLRPGSDLIGTVDGGGGINTLELGTGTGIGTLTSFSTELVNFGQFYVDAGASWLLNGSTTLAVGEDIADSGILTFGGTSAIYGAVTGTGTLSLGGSDTLQNSAQLTVSTVELASGTTALGGTSYNFDLAGSFVTRGGILALNGNLLAIEGAAVFSGGKIAGSGILQTSGNATLAGLVLGGGALWENFSTVTETGNLILGGAGGSSGTFSMSEPSAVFDITGNGGIAVAAGGFGGIQSGDQDIFEKTGGAGTSVIGAYIEDTGTITVAAGTLDFTGGGDFTGTLDGAGTLQFGGGADELNSGTALTSAKLLVSGGTITLGASLDYAGGFRQSSGALATAGHIFNLTGSATLIGGAISGEGFFTTHGSVTLSAYTVYFGAGWQVYGKVTETGNLYLGDASGSTGRVTTMAGGVFDIAGNGGIAVAAGGGGSVHNHGLLEKTGGAGDSVIAGNLVDDGKIEVMVGTLDFVGANNSFTGTISGAGTLQFGGGTSTLSIGTVLTVAHVMQSAGNLILGANLTYAGSFTEVSGHVLLNGHTLSLTGAVALSSGNVANTGIFATRGQTKLAAFAVNGGATWNNYGKVIATGTLFLGGSSGGVGHLANITGATFDIIGNGGIAIAAGGGGTLVNRAMFEKTGGAGDSKIAPAIVNTGTLKVTTGTLDIAGAVSGTGRAVIGLAGTLKFDGAVASTQAVSFAGKTGSGDLILNDPAGTGLRFAGTISGFGGTDRIDLETFRIGKPKVKWVQSGDKGTLTVTDGADIAKIVLFGQYSQAGFKPVTSGTGTVITYTAPAEKVALASPHQ